MSLVSKEFTTPVRVIYADTDKMGIVYHARYLNYFEIARNEMLREIGFPYKFLEENNIYLPVIETKINYYKPARYDDLLHIKTTLRREPQKILRIYMDCSVFLDEVLLAKGYTVHVMSNSEGKPQKAPSHIQIPFFSRLFD